MPGPADRGRRGRGHDGADRRGHRWRPTTFRLRSIAGHEPWEPVVVILTDPPSPDDPAWAALIALVAGHRGVAVVGVGLPEAAGGGRRRRHAPGAQWTVRPHGLDEASAELLAAALDEPPVDVIDESRRRLEDEISDETSNRRTKDDHRGPSWCGCSVRWTWSLRMGCPPSSSGPRRWSSSCGWPSTATATRTGARAALWAADVSNASFSNVVSEARRALARLAAPPDGEEWLARTYAERLPLHAEVVLDADIVRSA